MSSDTPRRPGRPSSVDLNHVVTTALALWTERGFALTGWQDLADATGVGVRTLQRHFQRREDIAELGIAPATARLESSLTAAPAELSPADAVREAIRHSVNSAPNAVHMAAPWLRLLQREPDLAISATRAYEPWLQTISRFLAERLPEAPPAVCRSVATAYQAAAFAALTEWADAGCTGDPADAVHALLGWIHVGSPEAP